MKFKIRKLWMGIICVTVLGGIGWLNNTSLYANAVTPTEQFYFQYNSVTQSTGTEIVVKELNPKLAVNCDDGIAASDVITWESSNKNVIVIADPTQKHIVELTRKGPGYATITAFITRNLITYKIVCQVKVELDIDYTKSFTEDITTTGVNVLELEAIGVSKKIYLMNDTNPVSSGATSITWKSEDANVATVNEYGFVKAVGAGKTTILMTTATQSGTSETMSKIATVVVSPLAKYPSDSTLAHKDILNITNAPNEPSNFVINTNATFATNIIWEVYDGKGNLISPTDKSKIELLVSSISGNIELINVKAGTYKIYGFTDNVYRKSVGYLEINIIVPIKVDNRNIVMNVSNTYSIVNNTNIPNAGIFTFVSSDSLLASVDGTTGVITAKRKGNVTIDLKYRGDLFDPLLVIDPIVINVSVIDGIALNNTESTIYTSGTMLLNAVTTDPSQEIIWTSSDNNVASVIGGLVTGKKAGVAIITASQTINGVIKSASCTIYVQQSVTKITIDPSEVSLNFGDYMTLYATIEPIGLNNVKLKWVSSNENVIKITKPGDVTATIQAGQIGGTAVISAINQDNVVVGSCLVIVKQKVDSITLSETSIVVPLSSKRIQLRAIVSPDNASNKKVTWSSTNNNIAKVDEYGYVSLLTSGSVSIIATSEDNPVVTAICNITVETPVLSLVLDETTKIMYVGEATRLTYSILPTNASIKTVTWSSTNIAVVTVDSSGLLTAKGVGQSVIILRMADGSIFKTCNVTVNQKATGVSFDVDNLELNIGQSYTIQTTMTPADSTEVALKWESTNSNVATVDLKGKVTGKSVGKAVIIAKTLLGGTVYCNVTVLQQVTGLQLNYNSKTIVKGEKFVIKATILPSTATTMEVTWTSSNTKVVTVSTKGTVTSKSGGTAVITCKTKEGGYVELCVVHVVEPVTTIKLNKSSYKLGLGKSYTLKATIKTNAATNPTIKWTSSNNKIATVDTKGKVTGRALGYVTITTTAQDGSRVDASCYIRIVKIVTSISLNRSSVTTIEGRSFTLKATIRPSNATYRTVTWSTSDKSVAIVDSDGVVTTLKEGNAIITAAAKDGSGKVSRCYVIVRALTPATSVTILNQNLTMVVGETNTIQKAINPTASTDRYIWETDNKTVASVERSTGKVTARTPGIANITIMTESGKTATTKVTVVGLNVTSLVLEQYDPAYQLSVIGITSGVTWDVANSNIAVVTGGRVEARSIGSTTITASVNGRRLTCKLKVIKIK